MAIQLCAVVQPLLDALGSPIFVLLWWDRVADAQLWTRLKGGNLVGPAFMVVDFLGDSVLPQLPFYFIQQVVPHHLGRGCV